MDRRSALTNQRTFSKKAERDVYNYTEETLTGEIDARVQALKWGLTYFFPNHGGLLRRIVALPLFLPSSIRLAVNLLPAVAQWFFGYVPSTVPLEKIVWYAPVALSQLIAAVIWAYVEDFLALWQTSPKWVVLTLVAQIFLRQALHRGLTLPLVVITLGVFRAGIQEPSPILDQLTKAARRVDEEIAMAGSDASRPKDMGSYEYTPISKGQIRVLRLDGWLSDGLTPKFSMITKNLDCSASSQTSGALDEIMLEFIGGTTTENLGASGGYRFAAISYVWGNDSSKSYGIVVDNKWLEVPTNAFRILTQHVPYWEDKSTPYFWIDSVCINQKDNGEKEIQVAQMDQLYQRADVVMAYLKPTDPDMVDIATHFMQSLLRDISEQQPRKYGVAKILRGPLLGLYTHMAGSRYAPGGKSPSTGWEALSSLIANDYWSRLWIVQEIVLAGKLRVFYGQNEIGWDELALFMYYMTSAKHAEYMDSRFANFVSHSIKSNNIRIKNTMRFRLKRLDKKPIDLRRIYWAGSAMNCTNDLDRVFGMQGMMSGASRVMDIPADLMPNYKQGSDALYANVAKFFLCHNHDTDASSHPFKDTEWTLSVAGIGYKSSTSLGPIADDWPSWVPDWRVHNRILLPSMQSRSDVKPVHVRLVQDTRRLIVHCTRVSTITKILPVDHLFEPPTAQNIDGYVERCAWVVRSLMEALGADDMPQLTSSGEDVITLVGETLTAGLATPFLSGFEKYMVAWKSVYPLLKPIPGPDPSQVRDTLGVRGILEFSKQIMRILSAPAVIKFTGLTDVCGMRALAWTDDGRFALAPIESKPGDEVRVLAGGETFFVLRKTYVERGNASTEEVYRLLGDSYVHGRTASEAVSKAMEDGATEASIQII